MNDVQKVSMAILKYFNQRDSDPLTLAYDLSRYHSEAQEHIFEFVLNYIREVAEGEHFTPMMRVYSDIAKKMIHAADN